MFYSRISTEDKPRLIAPYENGDDCPCLAESLNNKRTTANTNVQQYVNDGRIESPRGDYRGRKMTRKWLSQSAQFWKKQRIHIGEN